MKKFWKHVLRSSIHNLGTLAGAACIIGLGIFVYVAMGDTLENLQSQIDDYYENSHLADVFAVVSGISQAEAKRLEEIPGIADVSVKMSCDARMLADGQQEIVTVHLMSYDENDTLNQIQRVGADSQNDGLYLGSKMMATDRYQTGTDVILMLDGTSRQVTLQGQCFAPDYIYALPPGGAMIPDGEIYDIACIDQKKMEDLLGVKDSYQELGFRLQPGYEYSDVRYQLADMLTSYGLTSLCDRSDQQSYNMVDGEVGELVSIGTILPIMFLSISVFMLYVVLKKMIDRDQSVIGTMKAMGMTDLELIAAYMVQGVLVGLFGAVAGSVLAAPMGKFMFHIYSDTFHLVDAVYQGYLLIRLKAVILAMAVSMAAVYLGVRGILMITPAQAMRARTPKVIAGFQIPDQWLRRLGTMERIGCRSISRNPFRGFLIVLAVAFPFSMSAVLFSFQPVAEQMFFNQFDKVETYDVQISLARYTTQLQAENTALELAGVRSSESVIQKVVELKFDNHTEFVMLYGLNRQSKLWRIMDVYDQYHEPSDEGLIINRRTADKLHVETGDLLEVNCIGLTPEPVVIPVVTIIDESFGSGCYLSGEGIRRYFNTNSISGTVLLDVERGRLEEVKAQLLKTSLVSWLVDTGRILDNYRATMQSMLTMINSFAIMSVLAGGIMIYNISMINIRERTNEFGTIMLMGGSRQEVGKILIFEQILYFLIGVLAGWPGSQGVKLLVEKLVLSDSFTINIKVGALGYLEAFLVCLLIFIITYAAQMRVIAKIHIVDVLKERE